MKVDLAVLAEAATVDASGRMNILGIFDAIEAESLPIRRDRLCLVLRVRGEVGEVGEKALSVRLSGRRGDPLLHASVPVRISPVSAGRGGISRNQVILNMNNLTLPEAGSYTFEVSSGEGVLCSVPFVVHDARARRVN